MKVAAVCWFAAMFFAWLLCGNSLEQVLAASKLLFTGMILGLVGGKIAQELEALRNKQRHTNRLHTR